MGNLSSKDTRRISFDNTFALSPAITVQHSIQDDNIMGYNSLTKATSDEIHFKDNNLPEIQDDVENDYWSHRIEHLKKEHLLINKIMETEYEKKIQSANDIAAPQKLTIERMHKLKPCIDWRAKILQCYEDNPHQPLVCSPVVQAFTRCVTSCRFEE